MADNYDADLIITSHMEDISDILSHITPPPLRTTTTSRYLVLFGVCLIILSFFILPFRYGTRQ
jgi:hypothetical protein